MINNKYYVVDAHCHIYPDKISQVAVKHTDDFYNDQLNVKSCYKGTVSDLILEGGQAGVDRFVVQSVATNAKQVKSINEFIAKEVQANNGKLVGLGTMHPESEDLTGDLQHLMELGLKGVKIHPDIQGFFIDDSRYMKIFELCEKNNVPVLSHTGDKRFDYSNPNRVIKVLNEFKNLTLIGAHFGGWSVWEEACEKFSGVENFYVDSSSSFYTLDKETSRNLILKYGVDKILFATDYPMWNIVREIEYLLDLNLAQTDYIKIFSENVKKVYKF